MGVRPLIYCKSDILRQRAAAVEKFDAALSRLIQDMIETMHAHQGIGLAAPQIGVGLSVFVVNPTRAPGRELVVVNPTLTLLTPGISVTEGCLSLPDVWGSVVRSAHVRLCGQDGKGASLRLDAEGLLAIILQHEVDHLCGKLFIDRLNWFRRMIIRYRMMRRL